MGDIWPILRRVPDVWHQRVGEKERNSGKRILKDAAIICEISKNAFKFQPL